MLRSIESIILFVDDIDSAAKWYAEIFETDVRHENPKFAFIRTPGVIIGFHPVDEKCPGGIGGTTVYWEVDDLAAAIAFLQSRGATLHRGPGATDFGAEVAMLVDPFGCTIGLNHASDASREAIGNSGGERAT
jgi:predicted enzyme related to lactoylglutathione lyase